MKTVQHVSVYKTHPPTDCQLCHQSLEGTLYDTRIPLYNTWGNICQDCFERHECRLGLGLGQKFVRQVDGKWLKVEG